MSKKSDHEQFYWKHWQSEKLPELEDHSEKKLELLRDYLVLYLEIVMKGTSGKEEQYVTLIDGFAGGGLYNGNKLGSPITILKAVEEAEARINPAPRGATHFRYTAPGRKPMIDAIKNLDTLAGCSGKLEYGKVQFEGRGRYAKIKAFTSLAPASAPEPEPEREQPVPPPQPAAVEQQPSPIEQLPAPSTGRPKGAKLNRVMGFSACAVAKALGKAGAKHEEADRIFRAHGIEMPKASLSVQLGFGRNPASWERHGKPAELTEVQIAKLRAGATG